METIYRKVPTGITSFDPVIKGGFPAGSFVLLLGEVGAGSQEFVYSSALMLSKMKYDHLRAKPDAKLPEKIVYISFTKSKENVLQSFATLKLASASELNSALTFVDLSTKYFARTQVPITWTTGSMGSLSELKSEQKNKSLYELLVETLDTYAPNNLVIIDSLTDVLRSAVADKVSWTDFVSLLKGIGRMSKQWDSTIYALLTSNIFDRSNEEEVSDCADGVLVFNWESTGANQRQRMMYIKKFRGLMPYLEEDNVVRFETKVSASRGFEISNIKEILGR
ncbi:RAD55 family ATPase [Methanocella arvoryzae]|uniref:KaiC-like domain-containing protein n=1 Tax=Methanocella arvoryzae (strain DSM 22066 / NBRC 105507 / MRE50) TaxID=351160 RepID=Q0W7M9_METAR|nr:RAD55 family ATPase [Methanocella arvoryzae]CAJ35614.1 conserved hypothetical protein [Methanocella arvoryzae MRE50]